MTRSLLLVLSLLAGCHDEPTIVITFTPQDLAGAQRDLARPAADAGTIARAAPDAGAAKPAPAADKCARDADCVLVQDGCCPCSAGGKMVAIAKSHAKAYAAKQGLTCKHTMCPQVLSSDPSCFGVAAACKAGACTYRAK
jgi:hypothetical protein